MEFLNNLEKVHWWHVLIGVGLALVLGSLAAKDRAVAAAGFGMIAIGFGEWLNHPKQIEFAFGGMLTSWPRHNRPVGVILDGVGFLLLMLGAFRLLFA